MNNREKKLDPDYDRDDVPMDPPEKEEVDIEPLPFFQVNIDTPK